MPKSTIADVREAGYTVAIASGSVEVEELALEGARGAAAPETVAADVEPIAQEVAAAAIGQGLAGAELEAIVRRATARALEQTQAGRDEKVAFHERALEAARAMPDVFVVTDAGDPSTTDDDVQIYVACKASGYGWDKAAQEILDALVAPPK
jgi:hypothetical protein